MRRDEIRKWKPLVMVPVWDPIGERNRLTRVLGARQSQRLKRGRCEALRDLLTEFGC